MHVYNKRKTVGFWIPMYMTARRLTVHMGNSTGDVSFNGLKTCHEVVFVRKLTVSHHDIIVTVGLVANGNGRNNQ